jgi:hypothetical protein
MRLTTLNGVVRGSLRLCNKSIHYYARFMKYASDGLQELIFDSLKITNTVRLPLNDFYEAEIPTDYVDFCKVGVQVGQFVRPLVQRDTINNLPDLNQTTGDQENYPNETETDDEWTDLFQWWGININSHGENTGAYYGLGAGSEPDTFKINEQRNVITCNQNVGVTTIVLEYISDGTYANSATRIPIYAKAAIEAYIDWKYKENSKSFGAYDAERAKALFTREHEKLRARKNDLTPELLHRIINRNRRASIKP